MHGDINTAFNISDDMYMYPDMDRGKMTATPPFSKPIHLRVDLQGSSRGRLAKPAEKLQQTPVLKELDFLSGRTTTRWKCMV